MTQVNMTKDQVKDMMSSMAKELMGEEFAAQIKDQIERNFREWEKMTASQQRALQGDAKKMAQAHIFGQYTKAAEGLEQVLPTIQGKTAFSGESFSSLVTELADAKCSRKDAIAAVEARKGVDPYLAKALEASTVSGGGVLIPIEYSSDFIGALYDRTVVRRLGARTLDMSSGAIQLGKQNGSATAYWMGENARITVSQQSFGSVNLNAKKLGILVPISNDLKRRRPAGFEAIVRDDIMAVGSIAEDAAMIRGTGADGQPRGIGPRIDAGNIITAESDPTLAEVYLDLMAMMYRVDAANIPQIQMGWMFNPRILYFLMSLLTADGVPVFMMELMRGTLFGAAFGSTNSIPRNLGVSGDETEIYYGDFSQVIIGETANLEVEESSQASYVDAAGVTQHGFQNDQSLVRLVHEVDVALRHNQAFSLLTACDWGATLDA